LAPLKVVLTLTKCGLVARSAVAILTTARVAINARFIWFLLFYEWLSPLLKSSGVAVERELWRVDVTPTLHK
jgi:hypothetical protein